MALKSYFQVKKRRVVSLEDLSPNDSSFQAALKSDEQLFPPTSEERQRVQKMREAAESCYNEAEADEEFFFRR